MPSRGGCFTLAAPSSQPSVLHPELSLCLSHVEGLDKAVASAGFVSPVADVRAVQTFVAQRPEVPGHERPEGERWAS